MNYENPGDSLPFPPSQSQPKGPSPGGPHSAPHPSLREEVMSYDNYKNNNNNSYKCLLGFPDGTGVRNPPAHGLMLETQETRFDPWVRKIPLEKEMATHSSILA